MSSEVLFSPCCVNCGSVIGDLGSEESQAFLSGVFYELLCFDCDPESAATTPSVFWQWEENELIDIGDIGFQVRDNALHVIGVSRARMHEYTHAPGLSSCTYLNRTDKKGGFWDYEVRYEVCQECCGNGRYFLGDGLDDCEECNGQGARVVELLLPRWILGLEIENV